MYSIQSYGQMIADRTRTEAYASALKRVVRPDSVVLDIGTGPGFFAVLAAKYGARHVYALEPSPVIQLAREIAAANDCSGRITFIQDLSTAVTLPKPVDVVVAEIHGSLPLFQQSAVSLIDARRRHLAPGGVMIPSRESMWVAIADAPKAYDRHAACWDDTSYGLDLRAARRLAFNAWNSVRILPEQLLVEPKQWAILDYSSLEDPNCSAAVEWIMERAGTGHGLSVWFDSTLGEGLGFSNAPGEPEKIFGRRFFPWPQPLKLASGDCVSVFLQATLVGDDYIWCWNTTVKSHQTGEITASFKQSNFLGEPFSPESLHRRSASYTPMLTQEGEIDRQILSLLDGRHTQGDIARDLMDRFPTRFRTWQETLTRIADLSEKYSRR